MEDSNVERWDGLRLWVYRTRNGQMPVAVIMRYSRGGRQQDILLGRSFVPPSDRELAQADPYVALLAGIVAVRGRVFTASGLNRLLAAEPAPSPVGDHGGTEAALDSTGRIKIESPPPL